MMIGGMNKGMVPQCNGQGKARGNLANTDKHHPYKSEEQCCAADAPGTRGHRARNRTTGFLHKKHGHAQIGNMIRTYPDLRKLPSKLPYSLALTIFGAKNINELIEMVNSSPKLVQMPGADPKDSKSYTFIKKPILV